MVEALTNEGAEFEILDERQVFDDEQRSGIGATDSPKILGLSRYGTALSVYRRLTGEAVPGKTSLPTWLGIKMESTVAELYTAATGYRTRRDDRHHRHPVKDFIVCHLDRRVWGDPRALVELKTRSRMAGWGDDGSADIPADTWVQVQHEMAVVDALVTHVAVLFGHHSYRTYIIPRDDDFISKLLIALTEFWEEHYLPQIPPLPTGAEQDTQDVRKRAGDSTNGELLAATPEQVAIVEKYRLAWDNARQADYALEETKNLLRVQIGQADGITGPFGTIWNRRAKDAVDVGWEQIAAVYQKTFENLARLMWAMDELDGALQVEGVDVSSPAGLQSLHEAVLSLYTTYKPGTRRLVPQFAEH